MRASQQPIHPSHKLRNTHPPKLPRANRPRPHPPGNNTGTTRPITGAQRGHRGSQPGLPPREPGRQAPGGPQVGSSVELCGPRLASWCGRRRANGWSGRRCVARALCSHTSRASAVVR
jgi:hypothetical protein